MTARSPAESNIRSDEERSDGEAEGDHRCGKSSNDWPGRRPDPPSNEIASEGTRETYNRNRESKRSGPTDDRW